MARAFASWARPSKSVRRSKWTADNGGRFRFVRFTFVHPTGVCTFRLQSFRREIYSVEPSSSTKIGRLNGVSTEPEGSPTREKIGSFRDVALRADRVADQRERIGKAKERRTLPNYGKVEGYNIGDPGGRRRPKPMC